LPVLLYIPLDYPLDKLEKILALASVSQWDGFVIGEYVKMDKGYEVGWKGKKLTIEKIIYIRQFCEERQIIIASGGVHQPKDALDLIQSGANYVQLHSGLIYSGPGLPKRIWWMFMLGGLPGFVAGFSVHWSIGYTNAIHLLPAYFSFALYVFGLILLYPYLMNKGERA
jgi:hypothetical protein